MADIEGCQDIMQEGAWRRIIHSLGLAEEVGNSWNQL